MQNLYQHEAHCLVGDCFDILSWLAAVYSKGYERQRAVNNSQCKLCYRSTIYRDGYASDFVFSCEDHNTSQLCLEGWIRGEIRNVLVSTGLFGFVWYSVSLDAFLWNVLVIQIYSRFLLLSKCQDTQRDLSCLSDL